VEVLAAHEPTCAKRPRRASNNTSASGGENANDDYRMGGDNNNGHHAPYFSHAPQPDLGQVSFEEFTYPADESSALLPDTGSSHLRAAEVAGPSETNRKISDSQGKHRLHFKSSCSFARTGSSQEQPYFLAAKSRCLSYGYQLDNRCVAL